MGFLDRLSTVAAPARMRSESYSQGYRTSFFSGEYAPEPWLGLLGGGVTPELALTLSYVYCATSIISDDFGTMTCQMFRNEPNGDRARVKFSDPGIGLLARKLQWQPNNWQTAKAFWSTMVWQYLLRPAAYAELIYRPGSDAFVEQLIPRHPDRVEQQVLSNGRLRYKLTEGNGSNRYVTQDEMFVVRNTSTDGMNALSRIDYGAGAVATGLSLQEYTKNYFNHGASAALLATYKGGDMDPEMEKALHASMSRYMSGVENAGGLMLVKEDIDVKNLGVDPKNAELLGLKNINGRDVARMFKMPPSWLGIEGASAYASEVQDAQNYVKRCQVPLAVEFEQAIQRDLILAIDKFFAKFNMDYLQRTDLLSRMQAYEIGIRARVIRPSEARIKEELSFDDDLDRLSEGDYRPGASGNTEPMPNSQEPEAFKEPKQTNARAHLKGTLAIHDNAVRCLRRERVAVEKIAKKHADDVEGWRAGLRDFYADHAVFVSETMRISMDTARAYAAQHGAALETKGLILLDGDAGASWERCEADELCGLALDDGRQAA